MTASAWCGGLADPVHDAQQAYRAVLDAFARPGQRVGVGRPVAGLPLGAAMAYLLLTLADDDTGVWWQQEADACAPWLRFHTGARLAAAPHEASFVALTDPRRMPALEEFAQGTAAAPERSATLLIEVPSLDDGPALHWHGPGIRSSQTVRIDGLAPAFWSQWQANRAAFPQGVDIVFTCGASAIGLPRTTRVARLEELSPCTLP